MTDKAELPEYKSPVAVYVNAELVPAETTFATDKPVGRTWVPLNAEAKAKVKAHDKDVLAEAKAVDGDADVAAKLAEREAEVRAELAVVIADLQKRAEAAEANAGSADDEVFEVLAEEAKAKDAEIADLKQRLKLFESGEKRETLSLKK